MRFGGNFMKYLENKAGKRKCLVTIISFCYHERFDWNKCQSFYR